jgi:hypothetical protein
VLIPFAISFYITDSQLMLYFLLLISKPEYASVACSSVTVNDSNKLERTQIKFIALCGGRF